MVLFADDSTVSIASKNNTDHESEINKTLSSIITWLDSNNLKINLKKTGYAF